MIELKVLAVGSEGRATEYRISPSPVMLGGKDSYGVEMLRLTVPAEWEGLVLRATFTPELCEGITKLVNEDGTLPITADVTAVPVGKLTVEATDEGGKRCYTHSVPYVVYDHEAVGETDPDIGSDAWQEYVKRTQAAIDAINLRSGTGENSTRQVNAVAGGKYFPVLEIEYTEDGRITVTVEGPTEGVARGDICSIYTYYGWTQADGNFDYFASVVEANETNIVLEPLDDRFSSYVLKAGEGAMLWIPSKPDVGTAEETASSFATGQNSIARMGGFAEGRETLAGAKFSHTEGRETKAAYASHAEGYGSEALGWWSHAEGQDAKASGHAAHAEGRETLASGGRAHAEGYQTEATNWDSHAEGSGTKATGQGAHAEGEKTEASGGRAHAEGQNTKATNWDAHAEGNGTVASGMRAHAEGYQTIAKGTNSHAEGQNTKANGGNSHAGGQDTTVDHTGALAHGRGLQTARNFQAVFGEYNEKDADAAVVVGNGTNDQSRSNAFVVKKDGRTYAAGKELQPAENTPIKSGSGKNSAEQTPDAQSWAPDAFQTELLADESVEKDTRGEILTGAYGDFSEVTGGKSQAKGKRAHAEGTSVVALGNYSHAEGNKTFSKGTNSHAEGLLTNAIGGNSHAEGTNTRSNGDNSHAEGDGSTAGGYASHVEGSGNVANGAGAHAEGGTNTATGDCSHAEGAGNTASGYASHAEGDSNQATGSAAHVGGVLSEATHNASFVHGTHLKTGRDNQAVFGAYNAADPDAILEVGNGTSESDRKNAFQVNADGTVYANGEKVSDFFFAEYGVTSYDEIVTAYNGGKVCACVCNNAVYMLTNITAVFAFFGAISEDISGGIGLKAKIAYVGSGGNSWEKEEHYLALKKDVSEAAKSAVDLALNDYQGIAYTDYSTVSYYDIFDANADGKMVVLTKKTDIGTDYYHLAEAANGIDDDPPPECIFTCVTTNADKQPILKRILVPMYGEATELDDIVISNTADKIAELEARIAALENV